MGSFKVIISPQALSQLQDYISYIQFTLLNEQAAKNVWEDALETRDVLSETAGSLKLCENSTLNKLGYRKINFIHHRYVMLYRVEGDVAYVDAIYHQLQDFETTFSDDLIQG